MKKLISLILAAVMVMSLAACGSKTDNGGSGDQAYTPASALDLLEKVWAAFPEDNKFPAGGGDYSEENITSGCAPAPRPFVIFSPI